MNAEEILRYLAICILLLIALVYFIRIERLDRNVHGRRIMRVHLALGLLTIMGLACVREAGLDFSESLTSFVAIVVSGGYALATWKDWIGGAVPPYAQSTIAAQLEHLFPE